MNFCCCFDDDEEEGVAVVVVVVSSPPPPPPCNFATTADAAPHETTERPAHASAPGNTTGDIIIMELFLFERKNEKQKKQKKEKGISDRSRAFSTELLSFPPRVSLDGKSASSARQTPIGIRNAMIPMFGDDLQLSMYVLWKPYCYSSSSSSS